MAQSSETPLRHRIAAALSAGLERARIPLIVIVAVGVLFIVGYTIYSQVHSKHVEKATTLAESIQTEYSNWQSASDTKKQAEIEKQINTQIDTILKDYPGTYAAQRALFVRADLAYEKKDWKNAESTYEQLATKYPDSYLAAVSLVNAAASAEENGDPKKAIELNKRVLELKGLVPEIPRAIFSLGRLYEGQGDFKQADTYYNKLVDSYPSSGWTNLARDRIIYLAADKGTSAIKSSKSSGN
jgi:tetratricopeptide (TPR) repeat protein